MEENKRTSLLDLVHNKNLFTGHQRGCTQMKNILKIECNPLLTKSVCNEKMAESINIKHNSYARNPRKILSNAPNQIT